MQRARNVVELKCCFKGFCSRQSQTGKEKGNEMALAANLLPSVPVDILSQYAKGILSRVSEAGSRVMA